MKNIFKIILMAAVLLGCTLSAKATKDWVSIPLLNGFGVTLLTNSTVNFGDTNVIYINTSSNMVWSLTNSFIQVTNYNQLTNPYPTTLWWGSYTISTNSINLPNPRAWEDAPLWCNENGDWNNNLTLSIACAGTNAVSTNKFTFTFAPLSSMGKLNNKVNPSQPNGIPPLLFQGTNSSLPTWTVAVENIGGTLITVVRTNIPQNTFQGAAGIRLVKVVSAGTVGGATLPAQITAIAVEGFK